MTDGNTPTEHPGKSSRGGLGALIAVILLPILAYGTIKFLQRPDHKPPFYARVSVDMEVNGQPVHLERIITCKTVVAGNGGDISVQIDSIFKRKRTEWVAWPRAFGEVLPDGSAVMVRTPYGCYRETVTDWSGEGHIRALRYDDDYLPLIGWSPEGENVETLELYLTKAYFSRPDARVKNVQVSTELVADTAPSGLDNFAWFSGQAHLPQNERKRLSFSSAAGWILEKEEWLGKNPDLDKLTAGHSLPTPLPQDSRMWIAPLISTLYNAEKVNTFLVVPEWRWRGADTNTPFILGHRRQGSHIQSHEIFSQMHSFQLNSEAGFIDLSEPYGSSYLVFHRTDNKGKDHALAAGKYIQKTAIGVGGHIFSPAESDVFYDPHSGRIYLVRHISLVTWAPINHPFSYNSDRSP